MASTRELIDHIIKAMQDPTVLTKKELADLAVRYANVCHQFNEGVENATTSLTKGDYLNTVSICDTNKLTEDQFWLNFEHRAFWIQMSNRLANVPVESLNLSGAETLAVFFNRQPERVERIRKYRDGMKRLEHLIGQRRVTLPELEKEYLSVQALASAAHVTIAESLEKLYWNRFRQLENRKRIKWLYTCVVVAVMVTSLGTGLGLYTYQQMNKGRLETAVQTLEQYLKSSEEDSSQLHVANDYLTSLRKRHPQLLEDAQMKQLSSRLEELLDEESQRLEIWTGMLGRLKQQIARRDVASETRLLDLGDLASTPEEKALIAKLEKQFHAVRDDLQRESDTLWRSKIGQLRSEVDEIMKKMNNPIPDMVVQMGGLPNVPSTLSPEVVAQMQTQLQICSRTLESYKNEDSFPEELKTRSEELDKLIDDCQSQLLGQMNAQSAFDKLVQNMESIEEYKKSLEAFVRTHGDSPAADDLKQVLIRYPLWVYIHDWSGYLIRNYQIIAGVGFYQDDLHTAVSEGHMFDSFPSELVGLDEIRHRFDYWKSVSERDTSAILKQLNAIFQTLSKRPLWCYTDTMDKWYYFDKMPQLTKAQTRATYIADVQGKDRRSTIIPPDGKIVPARFVDLGNQFKTALERVTDTTWNSTAIDMCSTVQSDDQLDPLVKAILLKYLLRLFINSDDILKTHLQPILDVYDRFSELDELTNVYEPTRSTDQQRQIARRLLQNLPDISLLNDRARREQNEYRQPISAGCQWIGCLRRTEQPTSNESVTSWTVMSKEGLDLSGKTGKLYIAEWITPEKPVADQWRLIQIGTMTNGKFDVRNQPIKLLEGTPVYMQ